MQDIADILLISQSVVALQEGFETLDSCEQNGFLRVFDVLINKILNKQESTLNTATSSFSRGISQMERH